MLRLARKLDPFSTGLLAAALFVAVNEAIRAHWFTAFFTFAIALIAVICIKQVQRSLYFR